MDSALSYVAGIASVLILFAVFDAAAEREAEPPRVVDQADTRSAHRPEPPPGGWNTDKPQSVIEEERRQHIEWCEKIYHRNVSCPGWDPSFLGER